MWLMKVPEHELLHKQRRASAASKFWSTTLAFIWAAEGIVSKVSAIEVGQLNVRVDISTGLYKKEI